MPRTVDVVAAITATLHDGTSMIVLNEGRTVRVAEGSVDFLRKRGAIRDEDPDERAPASPFDHDGDGRPGGDLPDDPPALTGKTKAELIAIAAAEGVEVDDSWTKAAIVDAIEAERGAGEDPPPA